MQTIVAGLTVLGGLLTVTAILWVLARVSQESRNVDAELRRIAAGDAAGTPDMPRATWNEAEHPAAYQAARSAAARKREFRGPGALGLLGVIVSTAASVWSLYLD